MKVATYTQAGSKKQVCSECEEEQTVTIEALEYTADATVEAGESISAAIEAAQGGDVIVVKAGTYAEQLFIQDKEITIIGEGEVIVSGPANYDDLQSVAKIAGESMDYTALVAVVNGAVANSETAKEDNTFTDLYEEGYDFYETPAAADAE